MKGNRDPPFASKHWEGHYFPYFPNSKVAETLDIMACLKRAHGVVNPKKATDLCAESW